MITEADGPFLDAVSAGNGSSVRLIYADWLGEQGTPEQSALGDFVRLHVRMAELAEFDERYLELRARAKALTLEWTDAWTAGLRSLGVTKTWFDDGLPFEFEIDAADYLNNADELVRLYPTWRAVRWSRVGRLLSEALAHPATERLTGLAISEELGDEGATRVSRALRLRNLKRLSLCNCLIDDAGIGALARSETLTQLTSLSLSKNRATTCGAESLVRSATLATLERLELRDVLRSDAVGFFGDAAVFPRLVQIDLGATRIDQAAARLLGNGRLFQYVREIDLSDCGLTGDAATDLLNSETLLSCERLRLGGNPLSAPNVFGLVHSPTLSALTDLSMGGFESETLGNVAAATISASAMANRLHSLEICKANVGNAGAIALASTPGLNQCRRLRLPQNRIGPAGVRALAHGQYLGRVQELDLDGNPLGSAGAEALAGQTGLTGLRRLSIARTEIGDAGAAAFEASRAFPALAELNAVASGVTDLPGSRWRNSPYFRSVAYFAT